MQAAISSFLAAVLGELALTKKQEGDAGRAYNLLRQTLHDKGFQGDYFCSIKRRKRRKRTTKKCPYSPSNSRSCFKTKRKMPFPKPDPETYNSYISLMMTLLTSSSEDVMIFGIFFSFSFLVGSSTLFNFYF